MSPFEGISHVGLLRMYSALLDEFRARGILRTSNNPLADYTEWLVAQKLDLSLQGNSTQGHDAVDRSGLRYQIKARRSGYQLGAIRNADRLLFDYLIAVIYTHECAIELALRIPHRLVLQYAQYTAHTNSSTLVITSALIQEPAVENITSLLGDSPIDDTAASPSAAPILPVPRQESFGALANVDDRRTQTSNHNVQVLAELGFQRDGTSSVFMNRQERILSPGVAQGKNGRYWFDIREANMMRLNRSTLILVVRIVPNHFIVEPFPQLHELLTSDVMDNRPNSGNVWGIYIDLGTTDAQIYNIKAPQRKLSVRLYDLDSVKTAIQSARTRS